MWCIIQVMWCDVSSKSGDVMHHTSYKTIWAWSNRPLLTNVTPKRSRPLNNLYLAWNTMTGLDMNVDSKGREHFCKPMQGQQITLSYKIIYNSLLQKHTWAPQAHSLLLNVYMNLYFAALYSTRIISRPFTYSDHSLDYSPESYNCVSC